MADIGSYLRKIGEDSEKKNDANKVIREVASLVESTAILTASPKVKKLVAGTGFLVSAVSVAKNVYELYKKTHEEDGYTVKISEVDDMFEIAEQWLFDVMPEEKQLSVYAHSNILRKSSSQVIPPDQPNKKVELNVAFDGTVAQKVTISGHEIEIHTQTPDNKGAQDQQSRKSQQYATRSINFLCKTLAARNAVLEELERRAQVLNTEQPGFWVSTRWGSFRRNANIPARSMDSVFLKEGQMDRIISGLRTFLDNEEAYTNTGIPYRTGVMLHGNPGSGKTSTATAIANTLGLNVYYIALSVIDDDDTFASLLDDVPPRSVIILEDIDVAKSVKNREDGAVEEQKGITMTGMLNALDGLVSAYGVITLMTTNHLKVMDPAIVRPGRVDFMEELSDIDNFQLRNICQYFLGHVPEELPVIDESWGISSADVVGVFKKHLPDFKNAEEDLITFLAEKVTSFTN